MLEQHSFQEVMAHFQRMCKYYQRKQECPMACPMNGVNISQCRKVAFEKPKETEEIVMAWAAEHPEPQYPTWGEYLASIGVMKPAQPDKAYEVWFTQLYSTNIPADIAEKLGIEPKEG